MSEHDVGDALLIADLRAYISMRERAHASECDDPTWPVPTDIALAKRALAILSANAAPAEQFAKWLEIGPKLAKAAGLYVGIKVSPAIISSQEPKQ